MEESEGLRYLMKLLPEYMRIGGERYILHRIGRIIGEDSWATAMFCRKCLWLYIPVVNSRMKCDDGILRVECYGCQEKHEFDKEKLGIVKNGLEVKEDRLEDYFG
ncbi:RNAse P component 4 [Encephalitozoon intestinalis]|nr:RNAse P component 4 [Encephalitozoon intestinalis]